MFGTFDKFFLKEAGVDTGVFKVHLVRGATTSAVLDKGVHISDILNTVDWSQESTPIIGHLQKIQLLRGC